MDENYQKTATIVTLGLLGMAVIAFIISVLFGVDISRLFV